MIKKTLPVLILLALSGSFSTAVAADKKETQNFYYPETLDLTPLGLQALNQIPGGLILIMPPDFNSWIWRL